MMVPKSRLLNLPSELRAQILSHLLYNPEPLSRMAETPIPPQSGPSSWLMELDPLVRVIEWSLVPKSDLQLHPAALRVCRQLYSEGCLILYRKNTLRVSVDVYNSNCLIDVLGIQNPDYLSQSTPLKIARFSKLHFQVYLDTRSKADQMTDDMLWDTCQQLVQGRVLETPQEWEHISVSVVNAGADPTRYDGLEPYSTFLKKALIGLTQLKSKTLRLDSHIPQDIESWLQDSIIVDGSAV